MTDQEVRQTVEDGLGLCQYCGGYVGVVDSGPITCRSCWKRFLFRRKTCKTISPFEIQGTLRNGKLSIAERLRGPFQIRLVFGGWTYFMREFDDWHKAAAVARRMKRALKDAMQEDKR